MKKYSPAERQAAFWAKVDQSGGPNACWPWLGTRSQLGYGRVIHDGKQRMAHQVAWEYVNGPWPAGRIGCHRCNNPPCANPAHTYPGTHLDNANDRYDRGLPRQPRRVRDPQTGKLVPRPAV